MTAARRVPLQSHRDVHRIDSAPRVVSTYHYPSGQDASSNTSRPLAAYDNRIPSHNWDCNIQSKITVRHTEPLSER
jgi:hypothetical protein